MDIKDFVRAPIIGHIKIGTKNERGLPQKLAHFNVEEDKATSIEYVDIFKQLYPNGTNKIAIRFVSENPIILRYKRYVNNKLACVGNNEKAITVGKDEKDSTTQIERACNDECEQRLNGKCKLYGSLKFVLEGIEAGGVWQLNTGGGASIASIATEIYKYRKAGISIVNVPFELTLTPRESIGYGTYYSVNLKRADIKPKLTVPNENKTEILQDNDSKLQISDGSEKKSEVKTETKKDAEKTTKKKITNTVAEKKEEKIEPNEKDNVSKTKPKEETSNYLQIQKYMSVMIKDYEFKKIIFLDNNKQNVEYVLHPKANQDILNYGIGSVINVLSSVLEMEQNILCKYELIKKAEESNKEELKKAV